MTASCLAPLSPSPPEARRGAARVGLTATARTEQNHVMPRMRHRWNAADRTRSASNWIDFGVNDLETFRQPERPEVVTDVSGTICYLCVRAGHCDNGAARGIRTPDPVITNDVLYQLSYCGGPCNSRAPATPQDACAPDIGHGPDWQEKGRPLEHDPEKWHRFPKVMPTYRRRSAAPAGQKSPPAAGLRLRRADLFDKFIARRLVVDPGIVGRAENRDHGRRAAGLGEVGAGTEQGCRCGGLRFGFGLRR